MNITATLPNLGAGFLRPGDNAIHFYYSKAEQVRFAGFLQEGLDRGAGVIVASVGERHPLADGLRPSRLQRTPNLLRLQVTADLHSTMASLAHAATALLQRTREVRLAVDFDGLVSTEAIFENEAELAQAVLGKLAIVVSQYDGNAFPAPVTMEQFHTHALTLVGNAFYSENRSCVSPTEYLRTRRSNQRAAAAAVAGSAAI